MAREEEKSNTLSIYKHIIGKHRKINGNAHEYLAQLDINKKNREFTPLQQLAQIPDSEHLIEYCICELGANMEIKDYQNNTALNLACWSSFTENANMLIRLGANVNNREDWGWSPLTQATWHCNYPLMLTLLENGSNPSTVVYEWEDVVVRGMTNLHISIMKEDVHCIVLLLRFGADIFAQDGEKKTPVDYLHEHYNDSKMQDLSMALRLNGNQFDCSTLLGLEFNHPQMPPNWDDKLLGGVDCTNIIHLLGDYEGFRYVGLLCKLEYFAELEETCRWLLELQNLDFDELDINLWLETQTKLKKKRLQIQYMVDILEFNKMPKLEHFESEMSQDQLEEIRQNKRQTMMLRDPVKMGSVASFVKEIFAIRRLNFIRNYEDKSWVYDIEAKVLEIRACWYELSHEMVSKLTDCIDELLMAGNGMEIEL